VTDISLGSGTIQYYRKRMLIFKTPAYSIENVGIDYILRLVFTFKADLSADLV